MGTLSIKLRNDKINSKNEAPIHIRIVQNRRSSYISTGLKVPIKFWDNVNKRIKPGFPNAARMNNLIAKHFSDAQTKMLEEKINNRFVSVKGISKSIKGTDCPTFFELAEIVTSRSKADNKLGTFDLRIAILKKFRDFLNGKDIQLSDITPKLLLQYDNYLQNEIKNKANTRSRDFRFLKLVFKEAYKLDFFTGQPNPFDRYVIKTVSTTKEFLTEDEIQAIENLDLSFNLQLDIYRKLFLFGCYGYGIRISDLLFLKTNQVADSRIKIKTKKTGNQLDVKLPKNAIEIIEWFKAINENSSYIFNLIPNDFNADDPRAVDLAISRETAKYNKALKTIAKKAEITKPLSSHISRHSFATRALRKGIDLYQVSALLTHASVKQTQVYAKIVSEELDRAAEKL
jgi:site-specific recombinase XerD